MRVEIYFGSHFLQKRAGICVIIIFLKDKFPHQFEGSHEFLTLKVQMDCRSTKFSTVSTVDLAPACTLYCTIV